MENASQALLIAGAVLIVIVLISVGMLIVQNAQEVVGEVGDTTTKQAIQTFNSQFETYAGNQKGATIRSLLGEVATSNSSNASGRIITIKLTLQSTGGTAETLTSSVDITKKQADIVSSATYRVEISGKDNDGYVNEITITRK